MSAKRRICMIGGSRFTRPLDATKARKFETIAPLGTFWVIGFADSLWPRRHQEWGATFYLLPGRLPPALRYLALFVAGGALCAWCIFVHGAQIVVAQSPYEAVPAALVKGAARLIGRRVVLIVESHGDFEASLFLQRPARFRSAYAPLLRTAARFGTRSADLLRAVSEVTGRQLLRWAGPRPLVTFHTWTDLEVFFAAGEERRRRAGVLYAGVLTPLKGIDTLIEAVARADPAAELFIIGRPIDPAYAATLRALADALLHGRVHFIGHVPQRELARRLADAAVFVLPSRSEGLPRVVLEAMAVGVPVIATAVGGIPEMIDAEVTGWLVPPRDAAALADRLRWILDHPGEAEAVGRRGREMTARRFSIEGYRRGYAALFDQADIILGTVPGHAAAVAQHRRHG